MLADEFTLQCSCCGGYFSVVAAAGSKVRCPHCEVVAVTDGFFTAPAGDLAESVVDPFHDAGPGGHAECILEGNFMQFECPYCQRAMKMLSEEAGGLADCPHCGLEIISPQPEYGDGPRLTEASRRQLGNLLRLKPGNRQVHQGRDQYSRGEHLTGEAKSRREAALSAGFPDFLGENLAPGASPELKVVSDPAQAEIPFQTVERMPIADRAGHSADAHFLPDSPRNDAQGRVLAITAGFLLLFLGVLFIALELYRSQQAEDFRTSATDRPGVMPIGSATDHEAVFALVRRAAGAGSVDELLPLIRSRDRVEPLIREYYRTRPIEPAGIVAFEDVLTTDTAGGSYLQFRGITEDGDRRPMAVEQTAAGKIAFDWELWVNIAALEWFEFINDRPTQQRSLRVCIARSEPQQRYFEDAGIGIEEGYGVRIWMAGSSRAFYAVLPKGNPDSAAAWRTTSWEPLRRVVADLSFPEDTGEPARIVVHRILQSRWLVP